METIETSEYKLARWLNSDQIYIYEFWHKPVETTIPLGRYIKYTMEDEEIIVIEDSHYLG